MEVLPEVGQKSVQVGHGDRVMTIVLVTSCEVYMATMRIPIP